MKARFLLPLGLAGGAVLAGGVPGFLLAFTAGLLAVDQLLDRVGPNTVGADQAFSKLMRRRRSAPLEYLADDTGWAATAPRRRLGVQAIPVASIAGTTDPHKAEAFDRDFRPPKWSRERWKQLYLTAQRGTPLPPVSVYRVGDRHYVRDGHHRVSVARAIGADSIDAHVVELNENGLRNSGGRLSSSGGGTRTHNPSVNSRMLCH